MVEDPEHATQDEAGLVRRSPEWCSSGQQGLEAVPLFIGELGPTGRRGGGRRRDGGSGLAGGRACPRPSGDVAPAGDGLVDAAPMRPVQMETAVLAGLGQHA
jgi:hypothetical protein